MEGRFDHEHDEDSTVTPPPENTADSPISGDEAAEEAYAPSPKKRRCAHKKLVTVPIRDGDGDGSRSKAEVYPPPDSWSWRKYGQKPIKGSPYPRGYYRCSSSKGCPARKQVERSRLDPTTLLITYNCDHNHPLPTTTKHHHHHHQHHHNPPSPATAASSAAKSTITSSSSDTTSPPPAASFPPEECAAFSNQPDIEPTDNGFAELAGEFGWLCNVGSTVMNGMTLVAPTWGSQAAGDMEFAMPIGEEDKLLFGDLGDLPESSLVFRRYRVEAPCCGGTG